MASAADEKMDESTAGSSTSEAGASSSFEINNQPVCLIVLGMAGSGKTEFVKKLSQLSHLHKRNPYVVNLDPACREVPYHANIGELTR